MYNIDDIKNTVIHGDSEIELKKIPDESIDCVIIDPPYNLLKHKLDRAFDRELIYKELYRVLKNNSFLVVFGSGLQLCKDIVMLNKIGFQVKEEVIWVKQHISNFLNNLPRKHESFYILVKGNKPINKCYVDFLDKKLNELDLENIKITYDRIKSALKKDCNIELLNQYLNEGILVYEKKAKKHLIVDNTKKRPKLFFSLIKSIKDGIVENTCLGAIKNNRNYIGIEIDKEYYDICCDRIKEKQGLFAGV